VLAHPEKKEWSLADFDYHLPEELIAQTPVKDRPSARLLTAERDTGRWQHRQFMDLTACLKAGDCLVLNDTKVLPARLFGHKESGALIEILLARELAQDQWEALLRPGSRVKKGTRILIGEPDNGLVAEALEESRVNSALRTLRFERAEKTSREKSVRDLLLEAGNMPLPPYIERAVNAEDSDMYQTVFAKHLGAVASPTAGLHFDDALLNALSAKGVEIAFVTLHVGYGTFQPVAVENIREHKMHPEYYSVSVETAAKVSQALREERRVVACGTTTVRTLETVAHKTPSGQDAISAGSGESNIFIYPGYEFKVVDAMITNFHLPRTTLLMMLSAFMGHQAMMAAYQEAVREKYRFFSYGDAMFIQ